MHLLRDLNPLDPESGPTLAIERFHDQRLFTGGSHGFHAFPVFHVSVFHVWLRDHWFLKSGGAGGNIDLLDVFAALEARVCLKY